MLRYGPPLLPRDQINALQAIRVEIHGGQHGQIETIPPYGTGCLGVIDGDYQGAGEIIGRLDPERDVHAFEAAWHDPTHNDAWFARKIQRVAAESALIDVDPFDLSAFIIQARQGMVISPPGYAECLAIQRNIRREFADATEQDRLEWLEQRKRAGELFSPGQDESVAFRDTKIVQRLGAIAVTMNTSRRRWRRSILAMTVGDAHTENLQSFLRANGVRAKTYCYSPNLSERIGLDFDYIGSGKDLAAKKREEWIANADRILANRGN